MHQHISYLDRVWHRTARMLASRLGAPLVLTGTLALAGGASLLLNQADGQAAQSRFVPAVVHAQGQACVATPRHDDDRASAWDNGDSSHGWHDGYSSGGWGDNASDGNATNVWRGDHVSTMGLVYSGCAWSGLVYSDTSQP